MDRTPMPFFWIIDDEWPNHHIESTILKQAYPGCTIYESGIPFEHELSKIGENVDIVIAQISASINKDVIRQLKRCKGIAVFGSGFDNVDVAAAKECGIPVTNVNGYCARDIADYVLAAIFHICKPIQRFSRNIFNGKWGAQSIEQPIHRMNRQTLLLLGFGHIGRVTAEYAGALGMEILVYDPYLPAETIQSCGAVPVSLEDGLRRADFVSVHIKPTEQTKNFVNLNLMQQMKKTAVLINTARGSLVCEEDLIQAVEEGIIGGAVLDVTMQEPIAQDNPLLRTDHILVTPHISFASQESMIELRQRTVENALMMYRGETPRDLVRI